MTAPTAIRRREPRTGAVWIMSLVGAVLSLGLIGGIVVACMAAYAVLRSRARGGFIEVDLAAQATLAGVLVILALSGGHVVVRVLRVPQPVRTTAMASGFVALASIVVSFAVVALLLARFPFPFMLVYGIAIAFVGAAIWSLVTMDAIRTA